VVVSRSADRGKTWKRHTAARTVGGAFFASVAARPGGHVAVLYYVKVGDQVSVKVVHSVDHGSTWSAPITIAGPFSWSHLTLSTDATPLGPYQQLTAFPDGYGAAIAVGNGSSGADRQDIVFVRLTET
jgi:hypothetical protein